MLKILKRSIDNNKNDMLNILSKLCTALTDLNKKKSYK